MSEHYSKKVDRHVYGIEDGCQTPADWIQLAIAALDQAGFSKKSQNTLRLEILNCATEDKVVLLENYLAPE